MKLTDRILKSLGEDVWHPDTHGPVDKWPVEQRQLYFFVSAAVADAVSILITEVTFQSNKKVRETLKEGGDLSEVVAYSLANGGLGAAFAIGQAFTEDAPVRPKQDPIEVDWAMPPPRPNVFAKGMSIFHSIRQRLALGTRQA